MQRHEEAREGPVLWGVADQQMAGDGDPPAVLGSQGHQGLGVSRRGSPADSLPKSITLAAAGSMASGRGRAVPTVLLATGVQTRWKAPTVKGLAAGKGPAPDTRKKRGRI